jgi:hypothetical protein
MNSLVHKVILKILMMSLLRKIYFLGIKEIARVAKLHERELS